MNDIQSASVADHIGNTPLLKLTDDKNSIYVKYEGANFFGSSKDRAAKYVIEKLIADGSLKEGMTVIESSSGNMGIALAAICKIHKLNFVCVIDPGILPINEFLIKSHGASIITVTEKDENNSYLLARLDAVEQFLNDNPNAYWFNQYNNPLIIEAYGKTLASEIITCGIHFDYIFIAVSSLGTIAGVSQEISKKKPNTKVIAVDVFGSKIFDSSNTKRHLTGIGASKSGENLKKSIIFDKVLVSEKQGVNACYELLTKHLIFAGGSSGCVFAAMNDYIAQNHLENKNILCIFNDMGERYYSTIFNKEWLKKYFSKA